MERLGDILSKPAPDILYHYTDTKGVLGIVDSSSMWATSLLYLNDTTEYSYAYELLLQEAKVYNHIYEIILRYKRDDIFVCSFSEEKDLLSQWRAYSDNARGFSIGFKSSSIQILAKYQKFCLLPCIYDPDTQKKVISDRLVKYNLIMKNNPSGFDIGELVKDFYTIFPIIKHPKFSEEKEWRLISEAIVEKRTWKFRVGKYSIIPYVEFGLKHDQYGSHVIHEIMIGPGLDYDLNERALSNILDTSYDISIPSRKILKSEVPYRS